MIPQRSDHAVSNQEFMRAIFSDLAQDEYCWTTAFAADPSKGEWSGARTYPEHVQDTPFANAYFSVAALRADANGIKKRRADNFSRLMCIVLDDVGECDLAPSWRLETSSGKFQVGYILADPVTDKDIAQRLHAALNTQKLIKLDVSGNNLVRYVRLPVGKNTKYAPHFDCVLHAWNPHVKVTVADFCASIGINTDAVFSGLSGVPQSPTISTAERIPDETYIANVVSGNAYHESLNILAARYHSRGMTSYNIIATLQGIMQAANDGSERWKTRYNDIKRSVMSAVAKFDPVLANTDATGDNNEHPLAKFVPVDLNALKPTEYVLDGILAAGVVIIAGSAGAGKTTQLVPLLCRVAHLCEHKDPLKPLLRRKIIYVTEDEHQVMRILRSMLESREFGSCTPEDVASWFHIVRAARLAPETIVKVAPLYQTLSTENVNPVNGKTYTASPLVAIDTLNSSIDLDNENDNSEVGKAIALLKQRFEGIPIIGVGHTAKVLKRGDLRDLSARGASAWEGDAHQVMYLTAEEDGTRWLDVECGKHRFVRKADGIAFQTVSNVIRTHDLLGNPVLEGLVHGAPEIVRAGGKQAQKAEKEELTRMGKQAAQDLYVGDCEKTILAELASLSRSEYRTKNELCELIPTGSKNAKNAIIDSMIVRGLIAVSLTASAPEIEKREKQHTHAVRIADPSDERKSKIKDSLMRYAKRTT